jgi:REP element-mobilizing transposase RayT
MKIFNRQSLRLRYWNYASAANYFVTIKTKGNVRLFGQLHQGQMNLNTAGEIARKCLLEIPQHFPNAKAVVYAILPDHIHVIISIDERTDFYPASRLLHSYQQMTPRSLASIVKGFKIGVTKWCRAANGGNLGPNYVVWHRNYYEHIIRNPYSFYCIKNYIETNAERHWKAEQAPNV